MELMINNRFGVLLAEKQVQERRKICVNCLAKGALQSVDDRRSLGNTETDNPVPRSAQVRRGRLWRD